MCMMYVYDDCIMMRVKCFDTKFSWILDVSIFEVYSSLINADADAETVCYS